VDNFELTAATSRQPGISVTSTSSDTMHLEWDSLFGNSYAVEQSTNLLGDWTSLQSLVAASNSVLDYAASIRSNSAAYFRVCKARRFVDSSSPGEAQPNLASPTGDSWTLDFSDEFSTFDTNKWVKSVSVTSRTARPAQGIVDWWWRADHVAVSNGTLALKISKYDSDIMYCGAVESRNLYETAYGFLEARINCSPIEKGAHTAFWLQGHQMSNVNDSGADGCEVDIFESPYGNGGIDPQDQECQSVLHWDGYGADTQGATLHWNAEDVYTGYHTFGVHWTPDWLKFYCDGVLVWTYDNSTHATPGGVPQIAEWLWLSVGASFGDGNFQTETYPSYSLVDYVRVWKSN
jgi:beta-glucanase (GH16 family)